MPFRAVVGGVAKPTNTTVWLVSQPPSGAVPECSPRARTSPARADAAGPYINLTSRPVRLPTHIPEKNGPRRNLGTSSTENGNPGTTRHNLAGAHRVPGRRLSSTFPKRSLGPPPDTASPRPFAAAHPRKGQKLRVPHFRGTRKKNATPHSRRFGKRGGRGSIGPSAKINQCDLVPPASGQVEHSIRRADENTCWRAGSIFPTATGVFIPRRPVFWASASPINT